ncbi:MAG: glycosyltransferase family 39 protein [Acidobacteria bacterium]|nr:glycosyltransferase family 39 protein [Acidobacteriota bacterium]MBI3425763.1 glycosyltransferase family 39 protein [Acidobacteriota bacterium]
MRKAPFFATFALLLLTVSILSARRQSVTSDETNHVPAGYSYLKWGDFRANPEHPPFIKQFAALPLLWLNPEMSKVAPYWMEMGKGLIGPRHSDELLFGYEFLYQQNAGDRLVFWARIPIILLALLLGCGVGWWAWQLYGWQAGVTALLLYLLLPDLLAHGQLVTTDLGVSCFLFFSVYAFVRLLARANWQNVLLCGGLVGLALVTKFSAVLVFPMLALLALVFAFAPEKLVLKLPRRAEQVLTSPREKLWACAGLLAVIVAISTLVIWADYGFRYRLSPDPFVSMRLDWNRHWAQGGLLREAMHSAQNAQLLPEGYLFGFLEMLESIKGRQAFLLGQHSNTGWWYYFLVTFLVKTPLPLLILIGLGAVFIRRYGAGWWLETSLLLPVAIYWAVTLGSKINIGNRHLLPIYPFLIVFAAKAARAFAEPQQRFLKAALLLLLGWNLVETVRVYPHFLTYFNQIAGGSAGGYNWLVDSNLDWGQGLKELAKYRQAHPAEPFYFSYFGSADPAIYGIQAKYLPGFNPIALAEPEKTARFNEVPSGATVAVSATMLQGVLLNDQIAPGAGSFMQKLKLLAPEARVGNSIFIYRMP